MPLIRAASHPAAPGEVNLLVVGASARAACFSAARAGFRPYWVDQFGDTDLRAAFPGAVVAANEYPGAMAAALEAAPSAPLMYTGALENHGALLARIATRHALLGNDAATCAAVRDPVRLAGCLADNDLAFPRTLTTGSAVPAGRWLMKPLRSGGGMGIRVAVPGERAPPDQVLQEIVPGVPHAAVYVAGTEGVTLLGVTAQWVGRAELHAPAFSYCGSMGPVVEEPADMAHWQHIGDTLAGKFGLRGLFGVDAVVDADVVTVIEVNPRYTASVEVLEAATGVPALAWHGAAFGVAPAHPAAAVGTPAPIAGKAILFAPADIVFDAAAMAAAGDNVACADVPATGTAIPCGAPILSLLWRGESAEHGESALLRAAAAVYRVLL